MRTSLGGSEAFLLGRSALSVPPVCEEPTCWLEKLRQFKWPLVPRKRSCVAPRSTLGCASGVCSQGAPYEALSAGVARSLDRKGCSQGLETDPLKAQGRPRASVSALRRRDSLHNKLGVCSLKRFRGLPSFRRRDAVERCGPRSSMSLATHVSSLGACAARRIVLADPVQRCIALAARFSSGG